MAQERILSVDLTIRDLDYVSAIFVLKSILCMNIANSHILSVCIPTTYHTCFCSILLTLIIYIKACFMSCVCYHKQSHVHISKR